MKIIGITFMLILFVANICLAYPAMDSQYLPYGTCSYYAVNEFNKYAPQKVNWDVGPADWVTCAEKQGWDVSRDKYKPVLNSIIVWNGHVAIVSAIMSKGITVSEMNVGKKVNDSYEVSLYGTIKFEVTTGWNKEDIRYINYNNFDESQPFIGYIYPRLQKK